MSNRSSSFGHPPIDIQSTDDAELYLHRAVLTSLNSSHTNHSALQSALNTALMDLKSTRDKLISEANMRHDVESELLALRLQLIDSEDAVQRSNGEIARCAAALGRQEGENKLLEAELVYLRAPLKTEGSLIATDSSSVVPRNTRKKTRLIALRVVVDLETSARAMMIAWSETLRNEYRQRHMLILSVINMNEESCRSKSRCKSPSSSTVNRKRAFSAKPWYPPGAMNTFYHGGYSSPPRDVSRSVDVAPQSPLIHLHVGRALQQHYPSPSPRVAAPSPVRQVSPSSTVRSADNQVIHRTLDSMKKIMSELKRWK